MRTRISSKGQIVLPVQLRREDHVEAGEEFEIRRLDGGRYELVRCTPPPNAGLVDLLLGCPEKGFFVSIDSESTDDL